MKEEGELGRKRERENLYWGYVESMATVAVEEQKWRQGERKLKLAGLRSYRSANKINLTRTGWIAEYRIHVFYLRSSAIDASIHRPINVSNPLQDPVVQHMASPLLLARFCNFCFENRLSSNLTPQLSKHRRQLRGSHASSPHTVPYFILPTSKGSCRPHYHIIPPPPLFSPSGSEQRLASREHAEGERDVSELRVWNNTLVVQPRSRVRCLAFTFVERMVNTRLRLFIHHVHISN